MRPRRRPRFEVTPAQARADQERLAREASAVERPRGLASDSIRVAGADAAYARGCVFACVVVLEVPGFRVLEECYADRPAVFPYVPGLLAYREGPAVLDAFARVGRVDLAIFDAAGLAHPRRFGRIVDRGETVGSSLRTRAGVRPVYVSPGWALPLDDCVRAVLRCGAGYRLPEPTRLADIRVEAWRRSR